MKKRGFKSSRGGELRRRAEEQLGMEKTDAARTLAEDEVRTLLHELQVHRLELEMQNEELRRAHAELEDALSKYCDLYDFAPVGYFTLDEEGLVLETNLAGAALLGIERRSLIRRRLASFVAPESRHAFESFCTRLFETTAHHTCEARLLKKEEPHVHVRLEGTVPEHSLGKGKHCRLAMIDITDQKLAEALATRARDMLECTVDERTAELVGANEQLKQEIAERELAEAALRVSEEQLRFLTSKLLTTQEHERKRVAKEVHDDLGQGLFLLTLQISSVRDRLRKDQGVLRRECNDALDCLKGSIESVRRISLDLSPSVLSDLGLSAALRQLIETFCKHSNATCFCLGIDELDGVFPPHVQISIYRVFQEALTNVGRHSGAASLSVLIRREQDAFDFVIRDNGKGFDVEDALLRGAPEKGLGLTAMEERVKMLGGSFNISSQKELGTHISFTIPTGEYR